MIKLIMRYHGEQESFREELQRLQNSQSLRILEESGKMVLLETSSNHLTALEKEFPQWVSTPLQTDIPSPVTRPNIGKKKK